MHREELKVRTFKTCFGKCIDKIKEIHAENKNKFVPINSLIYVPNAYSIYHLVKEIEKLAIPFFILTDNSNY